MPSIERCIRRLCGKKNKQKRRVKWVNAHFSVVQHPNMHPPLAPHRHQMCETQIAALTRCHEENSVAKFWGVCNQVREMLGKCLQQEVVKTHVLSSVLIGFCVAAPCRTGGKCGKGEEAKGGAGKDAGGDPSRLIDYRIV